MNDSDLMRKAMTILNESMVEEDSPWKRTKAQQDFDFELDEVPHDKEDDDEDSDAHDKLKDRKFDDNNDNDNDDHDHDEDDEMDESTDEEEAPKAEKPKKEAEPKKEAAPKTSNKSKVDWASHGFPGMGEGIYEGDELNEGVNITLDGPEADEFVARLMQLSGQAVDMPAPEHHDDDAAIGALAAPVDVTPMDVEPVGMDSLAGEPGADLDGPFGSNIDLPTEPASVVSEEGECEGCHMPESECQCDELALENADFDYGHNKAESEGEEVDLETYLWKAIQSPQRMVKGVMGDNPMVKETMERYNEIVDSYVKFLNEGDETNEEGVASPLSASARDEFKKDPFAGDTPKDDGSMSPMSQIERQDIPK